MAFVKDFFVFRLQQSVSVRVMFAIPLYAVRKAMAAAVGFLHMVRAVLNLELA